MLGKILPLIALIAATYASSSSVSAQGTSSCKFVNDPAAADIAILACDAVIQLNKTRPDNVTAALGVRCTLHHMKGEIDLALDDCNQVVSRSANTAHALLQRCWVRVTSGRELELALQDCNESIHFDKGDPFAYEIRGLLNLRRNQFREALEDYSLALQFDDKDARSMYGRGVAEYALGDRPTAQRDISAALSTSATVADEYKMYGFQTDSEPLVRSEVEQPLLTCRKTNAVIPDGTKVDVTSVQLNLSRICGWSACMSGRRRARPHVRFGSKTGSRPA
jgi:tetratricopeptide (TPR) repeat protein